MSMDFLHKNGSLDATDMSDIERVIFGEETLCDLRHQRLLNEVRSLRHELDDPSYQYSGRIHRNAILCRNAMIDSLTAQLREAKLTEWEGTP